MHRALSEPQRLDKPRRILGVDRHRRGLRRDVRLAPAERDADVRKGERGRVVDAVADHHDRAALLERVDIVRLVLGKDLRMI